MLLALPPALAYQLPFSHFGAPLTASIPSSEILSRREYGIK